MGLLDAFTTANLGLAANQKWADLTARNIASANTPGYVRKDVVLATRGGGEGGGVYVARIDRQVDGSLTRMYRYEQARSKNYEARTAGLEQYVAVLGSPDDEKSPSSALSDLKEAFVRLSNSAGSAAVQRTVVSAADAFCTKMKEVSYALDQTKDEVRLSVETEVRKANDALERIAEVNRRLTQMQGLDADRSGLLDERDRALDDLAGTMNIRTYERSDGRISVMTGGGSTLIDGGVTHRITMRPDGRLMAGDVDITPSSDNPRGFDHGTIAGYVKLRDETLPTFRLQLDELARSVAQAFETADASRAPGDPGLFTDAGAAYDPARLEGLAGRLEVNKAVKPEQGGHLWRVREGVGATAEVGGSYTDQIARFLAGFTEPQSFDPKTGLPTRLTLEDFANNAVAHQHVAHADAAFARDQADVSLATIESSKLSFEGVNIDDELQKMMLIEKSYAANAQLISTVGRMVDEILNMA